VTFSVQPPTLRAQGDRLTTLSGDTAAAVSYAGDHLTLPRSDAGMFQHVVGAIEGVRDQVETMLGTMDRILGSSGTELRQVAHLYETTDAAEAAEYDAGLAEVDEAPLGPGPR
jgi:hypothetical protein